MGAPFQLDELTGQDDFTPVSKLDKNAARIAENVEFFRSTLGERRAGCVPITLPDGIVVNLTLDSVCWMFHHTPSDDESEDELWVMTVDITP